jgi:hypothetical protein
MNEPDDDDNDDCVDATIFDEGHLQSRLRVIRRYVSKPIPAQPWDDDVPALIPFRDDDDDDASGEGGGGGEGGGIIIGSARHAANIPLLKSMNVIAVLNCASGVSVFRRIPPFVCFFVLIVLAAVESARR